MSGTANALTNAESVLRWSARAKLLAALHALTRPAPDYVAARRHLDGALEAAHALAWLKGTE